jgi:hypothetical protein
VACGVTRFALASAFFWRQKATVQGLRMETFMVRTFEQQHGYLPIQPSVEPGLHDGREILFSPHAILHPTFFSFVTSLLNAGFVWHAQIIHLIGSANFLEAEARTMQ